MSDLLSQEEIDALLAGVEGGSVPTGTDDSGTGEGFSAYDFTRQDRIVRGRLPTLEMVNDRFARFFRTGLFNVLRKACQVAPLGVTMVKFSEYVHGLAVPSNLNLIRVKPLRGTALVTIEPRLAFSMIDNFFGGDGRYHARIEGRDFSQAEMRVIHLVLEQLFEDMVEAWQVIMPVQFEYLSSEINPQFANVVSPTETVVVSRFHVEIEGGGGQIHLTVPYAMIEPIRAMLDAGVQSDRVDRDDRWAKTLADDVLDAQVELSALLVEKTVTGRQFMRLQAGDILPIDLPRTATVFVENVPIYRAKYGRSNGHVAIQLHEPIGRRESRTSSELIMEKSVR